MKKKDDDDGDDDDCSVLTMLEMMISMSNSGISPTYIIMSCQ